MSRDDPPTTHLLREAGGIVGILLLVVLALGAMAVIGATIQVLVWDPLGF